MKKQFLDQLDKLLFALNEEERGEILYFYKERIENGVFEGKSEEQVINSLEKPSIIAKNIYKEYGINYEAFFTEKVEHKVEEVKESTTANPYEYKYERTDRDILFDKLHGAITGSSVFIAIAIFLFLGFAKNMWHPAWLVFIIIPLSATLIETCRNIQALPGVMVFISTGAFFLTGFNGHWGLGTIWFLLIPLSGALISPFTPHWSQMNDNKEYFKEVVQKDLTQQEKQNIEQIKEEQVKAEKEDKDDSSMVKKAFIIIGLVFFDLCFSIGILSGLFGMAVGAIASLSVIVSPAWIIINSPYLSFTEVVTLGSLSAYLFILILFFAFVAVEIFIFVLKWIVILHIKVLSSNNTLMISNVKNWSLIKKTKRGKYGSFRKSRSSFKTVSILTLVGLVVPIVFTPMLLLGDTFVNRYINDSYLESNTITFELGSFDEAYIAHINGAVIINVDSNATSITFDHYYDFDVRKDIKIGLDSKNDRLLNVTNVDNSGIEKYFTNQARREKLVITVPNIESYKFNINEKTVYRICMPNEGCRWTI